MELLLLVGMFFVEMNFCKLANLADLRLLVGIFFVEGVGVNNTSCGIAVACEHVLCRGGFV